MNTLVAKLTILDQFDSNNNELLWEDSTESRWNHSYSHLNIGEFGIFAAGKFVLVGELSKKTNGKSLLFSNISKYNVSNDNLLRKHSFYPEYAARVKAQFHPFLHPKDLNIPALLNELNDNLSLINFFVIKHNQKLEEIEELKENDRIIQIDDEGKFDTIKFYQNGKLTPSNFNAEIETSVHGFTIDEITQYLKSIYADKINSGKRSNNLDRFKRIKKAINNDEVYQFKTFFSYYDALINKTRYSDLIDDESINYWILNGFDDEKVNHCLDNNVFRMQFQYNHQSTSHVTANLKNAKMIKSGDKAILYKPKNQYYATGTFVELEEEETDITVNLGKQIKNRIENERGEIYIFDDAPCYYEDLRENNDFQGDWGQILTVDLWENVNKNGIYKEGISKHVDNTRNTIMKVDKEFFKELETALNLKKSDHVQENDTTLITTTPKNQILFGPPGTGKTYSTFKKAVQIVDPDFFRTEDWEKNLQEHFRSLIYNEKNNPNGQIIFTTFHQSLSYEDFIEGIKPRIADEDDDENGAEEINRKTDIDYIIKDGIFKQAVNIAKRSTKSKLKFEDLWNEYVDDLRSTSEKIIFTSINSELRLDSIAENNNSIYVRFKRSWDTNEHEGTRAFTVSKNMIERLYDAKVDGSETNKNGRSDVAKHVGPGRATHIYSVYKDFYNYALKKGALSSDKSLNYVIIIDEINRGNVSSIFGELITLIEEDKRIGRPHQIPVVLPYSREQFGVPANLYIIGTMNTADRSVEALDTALRRRFSFEEMPPQYDLKGLNYSFAGTTGADILRTINDRVLKLLDKDHLIGHSYFLLEDGTDPVIKLKRSFYENIIPLLQEYFYGDYAKIGAILGDGFVYSSDDAEEVLFASGYDNIDYTEKEEYFIRDYRKQNSFKIGEDQNGITFEKAILRLLNKK